MTELIRRVAAPVRHLRRQPLIASLAVFILGFTITFFLAVFSILDAALLRPFPHLETERWVYLWEQQRREGNVQRVGASLPNYIDWKTESRTVEEMAAWNYYSFTISGPEAPAVRVPALVTTVNVFRATGASPDRGRWLNDEDSKNAERNVVISQSLWRSRFGADPSIVGRTIDLNLVPHTVVGVAPPSFSFPPESRTDIWIAMPGSWLEGDRDRSARGFRVAGLVRKDVSIAQVEQDLNGIAARLASTYREDEGYGVEVIPMRDAVAGDLRTPLFLLSGALLLVLLLGCANVAHLRLAGLEARRTEFATRLALGASTRQLGWMLAAESFLLAAVSAAIGTGLALPAARLLLGLTPDDQWPWLELRLDVRAVAFAVAVVAVVTLVTSLAPLVLVSRTRLYDAFRMHGAHSGGSSAWRRVFVVTQVSLALLPLVGATLLVQSYTRLQEHDPGFSPENRAAFAYSAPRARYEDFPSLRQLADRMEAALTETPGVTAAGLGSSPPFGGGVRWYQAVTRENPSNVPNVGMLPLSRFAVVTQGFLPAIGARLMEGEWFTQSDAISSRRIAVINESAARQFFPGESPVGKQFWVGHAEGLPGSEPRTIVAVVKDLHVDDLTGEVGPFVWVPLHQETLTSNIWRTLTAVVRTAGDPEKSVASIRTSVSEVDAELALTNFRLMEGLIGDSLWRSRLLSFVFAGFATLSLALATVGVFALSAFLAQQRAREFGIRVALGAQSGDIARLVLFDDIATIAGAFSVGLFAAYLSGKALESVLFEVDPNDPWLLASAAALLFGAIVAARLAASTRATAVNPARLLRDS